MLAQAEEGLGCFLLPRFRPDGSVNGMRFLRLKDKLGNRSNASAEVEFKDAFAWGMGEPGQGVRTIIDMVQLTRLDCAVASAGLMRGVLRPGAAPRASSQRVRATADRATIDARGTRRPRPRSRRCGRCGHAALPFVRPCGHKPIEAARARLLTPALKFWVCKRAPGFVWEAMECLGGNGYVEESMLARFYREAPVNAIWEGSGNVVCLDVLRVLVREPEAAVAVFERLKAETDGLPGATEAIRSIAALLASPEREACARALVERFALIAAAAACRESAPAQVAECFARTRLFAAGAAYGSRTFGVSEMALLLGRAMAA